MSDEKLTDEELAAMAKFGSEMDGIDELFGNTPGSCAAVGSLVARALTELRALRQAALSEEDVEALRFATKVVGASEYLFSDRLGDPKVKAHVERCKQALAVLTRLVEQKP